MQGRKSFVQWNGIYAKFLGSPPTGVGLDGPSASKMLAVLPLFEMIRETNMINAGKSFASWHLGALALYSRFFSGDVTRNTTPLKEPRLEPHPTLSAHKDAKVDAKAFYAYETLRSSFFVFLASLRWE